MSKRDDGGSAFPIPLDDRPGAYPAEPGMSLRDYFASDLAAALVVSSASDPKGLMRAVDKSGCSNASDWIAETAYQLADSMLAQRSKE